MSIESVIVYNLLYLLWEFRGPSVLLQIELFHSFLWLSSIGRRQWQPTPVLLPGKSHGWRSLVGCSPWGRWESDTTERLHFHFSLSCIGEGNGNPLQFSCLENPRDGGAWWAAVYGVAQSRTWLKRLSSSSSSRWPINNKYLFLTVLETGKSKIKVPEWSLSGERPLPGLSGNSLLCPHIVGGQRISLETLL